MDDVHSQTTTFSALADFDPLLPEHKAFLGADQTLMGQLRTLFPLATHPSSANSTSMGLEVKDYTAFALLFPAGLFAGHFPGNDQNVNGIPDWIELGLVNGIDPNGDTDGNGISNLVQLELGMSLDAEMGGFVDSDGDGMSDAFELAVGLDPNHFDDAVSDQEGDGVFAFEEYAFGSSPLRPDSFNARRPISVYTVVENSEVSGSFDLLGIRELPITDWEGWNGLTIRWAIHDGPESPENASAVVRSLTTQETIDLTLATAGKPSRFFISAPLSEDDWDGDGLTNAEEYFLLLNYEPNGVPLTVWEIGAFLRNTDSDGDGIPDAAEDWTGSGMSNRNFLNGLSEGPFNVVLTDMADPTTPPEANGEEEPSEEGEAVSLLLTVTYPTNGLVIP